jgi:hypothetical protein
MFARRLDMASTRYRQLIDPIYALKCEIGFGAFGPNAWDQRLFVPKLSSD